jgi:hypothetical protein
LLLFRCLFAAEAPGVGDCVHEVEFEISKWNDKQDRLDRAVFSLSSTEWRFGRGSAMEMTRPSSDFPSPHSCLAGRGRKTRTSVAFYPSHSSSACLPP